MRNHPSKSSTAHQHAVLNFDLTFRTKPIVSLEESEHNINERTQCMYLQINQIEIKSND